MYRSHYGNRKRKSGLYSESKLTNWTEYNPYNTEAGQIIDKFLNKKPDNNKIIIEKNRTHPKFVMPVSVADIEYTLSLLPKKFIRELKAIYLLSGTNKQEIFAGKNIVYGRYYYNLQIIMLYPFPYKYLSHTYKKLPAPHKINDFKRAGARIKKIKQGWKVEFSLMNLRNFYLNDVLIHEIGHHVDKIYNTYDKSNNKIENFAEYFVQKYRIADNR